MNIKIENWQKLAESLQKEATIMGYRNTAENLEKLYAQKLAVVKLDQAGEIVTFGGFWPTPDDKCLEAGSFWVHPLYRDKKYSSWMFRELSKKIPTGCLSMVITHVNKVAHLVVKAGWIEATRNDWCDVVPLITSCGPCDVIADSEKPNCPYMATKAMCRLFYKKG